MSEPAGQPVSKEACKPTRTSTFIFVREDQLHIAVIVPHHLIEDQAEKAAAIENGIAYFHQELSAAGALFSTGDFTVGNYHTSNPQMAVYDPRVPMREIVTPALPYPQRILPAFTSAKERALITLTREQPPEEVIAQYILASIAARLEKQMLNQLFFMRYPLYHGTALDLVYLPRVGHITESARSLFSNEYVRNLFERHGLRIQVSDYDVIFRGIIARISPIENLSNLEFEFFLGSEIQRLLADAPVVLRQLPYEQAWLFTSTVRGILEKYIIHRGTINKVTFTSPS